MFWFGLGFGLVLGLGWVFGYISGECSGEGRGRGRRKGSCWIDETNEAALVFWPSLRSSVMIRSKLEGFSRTREIAFSGVDTRSIVGGLLRWLSEYSASTSSVRSPSSSKVYES